MVCVAPDFHQPSMRRSLQAPAEGMQTPNDSPHGEPSLESLIRYQIPVYIILCLH